MASGARRRKCGFMFGVLMLGSAASSCACRWKGAGAILRLDCTVSSSVGRPGARFLLVRKKWSIGPPDRTCSGRSCFNIDKDV